MTNTTWRPRGLNKTVRAPHAVGDKVLLGSSRLHFEVVAVEYVERGTSRFDFYRLRRLEDGKLLEKLYTRMDLRPLPNTGVAK